MFTRRLRALSSLLRFSYPTWADLHGTPVVPGELDFSQIEESGAIALLEDI